MRKKMRRSSFWITCRKGVTEAIVPSLFYMEISNVLLTAYRRNRISRDSMHQYLDVISILPIIIDTDAAIQGNTIKVVCELADKHGLTTYDTSYLELAIRRGFPLATLDADLHKVAVELDIAYQIPSN
ncbi:VapC toxin family PIN domain ribonuclease [Candidatus Poribacteria bacterium]|nr:MAG: VapC toxin family PIN domain ribonuclease [Candidatus Poribacteria bacterium]